MSGFDNRELLASCVSSIDVGGSLPPAERRRGPLRPPPNLFFCDALPQNGSRGRSAADLLVRGRLVLDPDLTAAHGVADELLALPRGLAHRHLLDNPRLLGDD